jgi:hypothetical protein
MPLLISKIIRYNPAVIGRRITNFACLVLWRKKYIPRNAPIPPPIKAMRSKVLSGIRHFLFIALFLSIPITAKPKRLRAVRYPVINTSID